jgi:hypothetical protein
MGYPECVSACVAVGAIHDVDLGRVPKEGTFLSWCVAMEGSEACQGVPSCFDAVSVPDSPICFMDRTPCTQLVAPGWDIITTKIGGGKTEGLAGTSVSSPHAAAVAALLAGRCLSPDQVLEIMKTTGRVISDGCPTGAHEVTIIDAFAAVAAAEASYPLCKDCNRNSTPDDEDLRSGESADCDSNGVPDECEGGCNQNRIPDECDIASGRSADCNGNGISDECDVVLQRFSLGAPEKIQVGTAIVSVAAGDLDGDGKADLVTSNSSPRGLLVLFSSGDGSFQDPVVIPTSETTSSVITADLSGDGLLDLAGVMSGSFSRLSESLVVVTSGPERTFSEPRVIAVGSLPRAVIATDLDRDGDLDLVTVNEVSADVSVLRNDGKGELAEAVSHAAGTSRAFLAAADWDGDGDIDLIAASRKSRDLSLLSNDGTGAIGAPVPVHLPFLPVFFRVVDLNRDGLADVLTGEAASSEVSVFLRNPDGTLGKAASYEIWPGPVPLAPADVLVADVNGDGAADVVTANLRIDSVSVLLNKGDGTLRGAVEFDAGDGPRALAAGRLKARAGLDLVAVGSGTGAGTLELLFNGSEPPKSLDLNGNGIPDECETRFHRGDPNSSGTTDISDGITIFGFLFFGNPATLACLESADANNDGRIDVSDGIFSSTGSSVADANHRHRGRHPPPADWILIRRAPVAILAVFPMTGVERKAPRLKGDPHGPPSTKPAYWSSSLS